MIEALDITVKGIVQGVGFRPFVYRLAKQYLINGWVLNGIEGVFIHAEGESHLLDEFVLAISDNAPAAARVEEIELKEVPLEDFENFEIRFSDESEAEKTTLVSPDLATCDDCVRELFDPTDRRYRYPFINCTNCGPRFTIIDSLPYDRKATSMKDFPMCDACAREYADPADRRFHAQPDACFDCGPALSWRVHEGGDIAAPLTPVRWGADRVASDDILAEAVALLRNGHILAVKGLGGYHLVCDAENEAAVALLRTRKRREGKAFAVMMADCAAVRGVCTVSKPEEELLTSAARPIVLLKKRADVSLVPGLADKLPELGVMLPYTPVQHLLMHDFVAAGGSMLVMTSGNVHDNPIVINDEEAYSQLFTIADGFLGNNREILTRFDDSVARVLNFGEAGDAVQFVRRARGYAPLPLSLAVASGGSAGTPASVELTGAAPGGTASTSAEGAPVSAEDAAGDMPRTEASATESADTGTSTSALALASVSAPTSVSAPAETSAGANAPEDSASTVVGLAGVEIFATGPEQKNTFTLTRGDEVFVSQHIGDMENVDTYDAWLATKAHYEALFAIAPNVIARDLHPEYLTSKYAGKQDLLTMGIQHHHAHVASILGEYGLAGPVCGIAFDGTGYGADGALWGGETLLVNRGAFERFAQFSYIPMPGGAAAIKRPARMAYGVLWDCDLLEHPGATWLLETLGAEAAICDSLIEEGLNCPMTSSVGRLFDAASALLGVCTQPTYEGEPAILLEAAMGLYADIPANNLPGDGEEFGSHQEVIQQRYMVDIVKNVASPDSTAEQTAILLFDPAPVFRALLDDVVAGVEVGLIARRFHDAMVQAVYLSAELVRSMYDITTVALSGGVFMNRYLVEHAVALLQQAGFTVALNRDLPPNDGCVSFGQAVIAQSRLEHEDETAEE